MIRSIFEFIILFGLSFAIVKACSPNAQPPTQEQSAQCNLHQPLPGWSETQYYPDGEAYVVAPDGTEWPELYNDCCMGRQERICIDTR